jgi:CheY-like chemotaxis protein
VVDDEALIRMVLAEELADAGFKVVEAASGDEAVALMAGGLHVETVVTDVRMPGARDGVALAAWMAEHRPGVPVVVLSGYDLPPSAKCVNPAVIAVLPKPYKPAEIVKLVARARLPR